MRIFLEVKLKGKNEMVTKIQANSGADYIVLPKEIIEKIKPSKIKLKVRCHGVGGKEIESPLYKVGIEIEDPIKKLKRSCEAEAIMVEIGMPLLSHETMEKLGMILDFKKGTYELK